MRENESRSTPAATIIQIFRRRRLRGPTSITSGAGRLLTHLGYLISAADASLECAALQEGVLFSRGLVYNRQSAYAGNSLTGSLSHHSPAWAGRHGCGLRGRRPASRHHCRAEGDVVFRGTFAEAVRT